MRFRIFGWGEKLIRERGRKGKVVGPLAVEGDNGNSMQMHKSDRTQVVLVSIENGPYILEQSSTLL